jgi:hypothetical protein
MKMAFRNLYSCPSNKGHCVVSYVYLELEEQEVRSEL